MGSLRGPPKLFEGTNWLCFLELFVTASLRCSPKLFGWENLQSPQQFDEICSMDQVRSWWRTNRGYNARCNKKGRPDGRPFHFFCYCRVGSNNYALTAAGFCFAPACALAASSLNRPASCTAISASALRSSVMPARFKPCMNSL